jgi:multidrug efflux pump subunit AcrB
MAIAKSLTWVLDHPALMLLVFVLTLALTVFWR